MQYLNQYNDQCEESPTAGTGTARCDCGLRSLSLGSAGAQRFDALAGVGWSGCVCQCDGPRSEPVDVR